MKRLAMEICVGVAVSVLLGGCRSGVSDSQRRRVKPAGPIIFAPHRGPTLADNRRTDWPATDVSSNPNEFVVYTTSVYDRQGNFGSGEDSFYRRFQSTRKGRAHR